MIVTSLRGLPGPPSPRFGSSVVGAELSYDASSLVPNTSWWRDRPSWVRLRPSWVVRPLKGAAPRVSGVAHRLAAGLNVLPVAFAVARCGGGWRCCGGAKWCQGLRGLSGAGMVVPDAPDGRVVIHQHLLRHRGRGWRRSGCAGGCVACAHNSLDSNLCACR